MTVLQWQALAQLNQSVSVPELVSYLDIDRLMSHVDLPVSYRLGMMVENYCRC